MFLVLSSHLTVQGCCILCVLWYIWGAMNWLLVLATPELYVLKCINCEKYLKNLRLSVSYLHYQCNEKGRKEQYHDANVSAKNCDWLWYFVVPWVNCIWVALDKVLALHTGANTQFLWLHIVNKCGLIVNFLKTVADWYINSVTP